MLLTKVTATGPDDTTSVLKLVDLVSMFPKAEIGILVSPGSLNSGRSRFPSTSWMKSLYGAASRPNHSLLGRFSLHLCGGYVTEFLSGKPENVVQLLNTYAKMFSRVQINTHGKTTSGALSIVMVEDSIRALKKLGVEVIFQRDGVNNHIFDLLMLRKSVDNISTLFDLSAGAGILPRSWPNAIPGAKCGYAGGLSQENVTENIAKIEAMRPQEYWIDAEGKLMADDGHMNLVWVENYFRNARA